MLLDHQSRRWASGSFFFLLLLTGFFLIKTWSSPPAPPENTRQIGSWSYRMVQGRAISIYQVRSGQVRSGQVRAGQDRTGQGRALASPGTCVCRVSCVVGLFAHTHSSLLFSSLTCLQLVGGRPGSHALRLWLTWHHDDPRPSLTGGETSVALLVPSFDHPVPLLGVWVNMFYPPPPCARPLPGQEAWSCRV